jgi:uncharacterized protein YcbX
MNNSQDAQKGRPARPQRAKRRGGTLRYVEPLSDARTPLADFFSILLVVGGVEGLAERSWPGQCLHIGEVIIGIQDLRERCIMTTFDPDSLKQDRQVLTDIVRRFEGTLALNCYVIRGGEIRVGDTVDLAQRHECETVRA